MKNFIANRTPISVGGADLKKLDSITHLGCSIANNGDERNEIGIGIEKPELHSKV